MTRTIVVDGHSLGPADVRAVLAGEDCRFELTDDARERIEASRAVVERALEEDRTIYGVNTGFGKLADQKIPRDQVRQLQRNLLRSHATGVGRPLPDEEVALALLFRGNALAVWDLMQAADEGREPVSSGRDARWALEMILGVYASHLAGRPLPLPLDERQHPLMA